MSFNFFKIKFLKINIKVRILGAPQIRDLPERPNPGTRILSVFENRQPCREPPEPAWPAGVPGSQAALGASLRHRCRPASPRPRQAANGATGPDAAARLAGQHAAHRATISQSFCPLRRRRE